MIGLYHFSFLIVNFDQKLSTFVDVFLIFVLFFSHKINVV